MMHRKAKMIVAALSAAVLCITSAKADAAAASVTNAAFIRTHFGELQIGQSRKAVLAALSLPPMDEQNAMGSSFVDHEQYPLDSGETLYLYFEHDRETWRLKCAVIGSGVIHERFRTGTGMQPEVGIWGHVWTYDKPAGIRHDQEEDGTSMRPSPDGT